MPASRSQAESVPKTRRKGSPAEKPSSNISPTRRSVRTSLMDRREERAVAAKACLVFEDCVASIRLNRGAVEAA
jgi:hypothetical protein